MGKAYFKFPAPIFQKCQELVKIASGFFTVQGFNLLADALEGTTTFILVGYDDTQNKNLVGKLLADVKADLLRWDHFNRRQVVRQLVAKLIKREIYFRENDDEPYADSRIRKNDHGKVYIIDDEIVFLGSVNVTVKGLLYNDEADGAITEPERVNGWVNDFNEKWNDPDTKDLTRFLLNLLSKWLDLVDPFDIYLKSIQVLVEEAEPKPPRAKYKLPAVYQQVIIKRVVRQLKEYRGAMLVASTGMGKTIMATDVCLRLKHEGLIDTVLVFAPKSTHINWQDDLDSAGINNQTFSREILSQQSKGGEGRKLKRYLSKLDERYMIIIDESQYFKNENVAGGIQKHSFKQIIKWVRQSGCYVMLLTATPYSKGYEDINNQLKLLPHTAPRQNTTVTGQKVFESMVDDVIEYPNVWGVPEEDYFEVFRKLEVVTLVSTSWVAKNFGVSTPEGDYVQRPNDKVWIPRIHLSKINVPLPFELQIKNLMTRGYFRHEYKSFPTREGKFIRTNTRIEEIVSTSWSSSPASLREAIYKVMTDGYEVSFIISQPERYAVLSPIYSELIALQYQNDPKFRALQQLLIEHTREKIIIFTERKATAIYLKQAIQAHFPHRNVDTPITELNRYEYGSIDDNALQDMIHEFAPISNPRAEKPKRELDIIILTDANSTGINLQDANVVINYDLAWTPDVITQRGGRIMRLWKTPRTVYIYAFVGVFEHDETLGDKVNRVSRRFRALSLRSKDAQEITEIPILPEGDMQQITSLGEFNKVTIEEIGEIDAKEVEDYSGGSPFLRHITALVQNKERAENLDDDINSAKLYKGKDHLVYVLLRYQGEYIWLVYNITKNRTEKFSNDKLLELLECHVDTPFEPIDPDMLEEHAQYIRNEWCQDNKVNADDVERICALYLKPEREEESLESMIQIDSENWYETGE